MDEDNLAAMDLEQMLSMARAQQITGAIRGLATHCALMLVQATLDGRFVEKPECHGARMAPIARTYNPTADPCPQPEVGGLTDRAYDALLGQFNTRYIALAMGKPGRIEVAMDLALLLEGIARGGITVRPSERHAADPEVLGELWRDDFTGPIYVLTCGCWSTDDTADSVIKVSRDEGHMVRGLTPANEVPS